LTGDGLRLAVNELNSKLKYLPGGNFGIVFEKFILNIKVQGRRRLDARLRWQDGRRETRREKEAGCQPALAGREKGDEASEDKREGGEKYAVGKVREW